MYPRASITNPEPAPSTGTGSIKKSYSVAFVRIFATAPDACRYTRTLIDSSSVSVPSRAETSVSLVPSGNASTFLGCRSPQSPPAQYAPAIITTATTNNRTAFDAFPAFMLTILPRPRLTQTIPHQNSRAESVVAGLEPCAFLSVSFLLDTCRCPAPQLGSQLPHLPPRLLQRPRAINLLRSVLQLLH